MSGEIPPFDQPGLLAFNVSFNYLEGQIPKTDVLQMFPEESYQHNPGLCGVPLSNQCSSPPSPPPAPGPSHQKEKNLQFWSIALVGATILVPFLVILVFLCFHSSIHRRGTSDPSQPSNFSKEKCSISFGYLCSV